MNFKNYINAPSERNLLEASRTSLDIIVDLMDSESEWVNYIEEELLSKFPEAENVMQIPEKELKKVVDSIRSSVLNNPQYESPEVFNILGIKIDKNIVLKIRNKVNAGQTHWTKQYSNGWVDCYDFLASNNLLK